MIIAALFAMFVFSKLLFNNSFNSSDLPITAFPRNSFSFEGQDLYNMTSNMSQAFSTSFNFCNIDGENFF